MGVKSFDFTELDIFVKGVPRDVLAQLRRETPVYWNRIPNSAAEEGFWLITRHKDIVQIEKNPILFSSHYGLTLAAAPPSTCGPPWSMVRDGLTHLDPPEHDAHKQLIAPLFTSRAINAIENRIRAVANAVLDRACELQNFDFATEVALRFPVAVVLGELFGLPSEDFQQIIHWSDVIAAPYDPEFPRSAGWKVVQELYKYALSAKAMRLRKPTNDVLSILAHTKTADGTCMSDEIFVRYFWSLITGAFDTTASAISGGMLGLISFPAEHERLRADPSLVPLAVEEILRWETPTIYFGRTAMADTAIREQKILKGQRVLMCYASANRDEEVFARSGVFDVGRRPNDHLSFGRGVHFCLGSNLARSELRIIFDQIIRRKLRVELRGEIRRARSNFQNRIKYMPVTMCAA